MIGSANAAERARWEVLWIAKGRIVRFDCGTDLTEAMRVYGLAKGKRPGATLRCKNFGFPPPQNLQPRTVKYKKKVALAQAKIVRRNGKRYRKTHEVVVKEGLLVPMKKHNASGIWWCPYCRELRRFKMLVDIEVDAGNGKMIKLREPGMYCPMCGVSHRDFNVRKWNPQATQVYYQMQQQIVRAPARTTQARRKARQRKKARE
jgi:hypothetical protein